VSAETLQKYAAEVSLSTSTGGQAGDKAVTLAWTAKQGAVGYNVFSSTITGIANHKYTTTVYVNTATVSAIPGSGNRPNAADQTANANDYTGLIGFCENVVGAGAYYQSLDGATLTQDGTGAVNEIDTMFKSFYDNSKVSPDFLLVNSAQKKKIDQVTVGSTAPLYRIQLEAGNTNITGTMAVDSLKNRYMGGKEVRVIVHPNLPPSTILACCMNLGDYYPNARIPQNLALKLGWDYRKIDFAMVGRRSEMGIDCNGALVNYAQFAMGAITNVG
jgi:hypothetical protein